MPRTLLILVIDDRSRPVLRHMIIHAASYDTTPDNPPHKGYPDRPLDESKLLGPAAGVSLRRLKADEYVLSTNTSTPSKADEHPS